MVFGAANYLRRQDILLALPMALASPCALALDRGCRHPHAERGRARAVFRARSAVVSLRRASPSIRCPDTCDAALACRFRRLCVGYARRWPCRRTVSVREENFLKRNQTFADMVSS